MNIECSAELHTGQIGSSATATLDIRSSAGLNAWTLDAAIIGDVSLGDLYAKHYNQVIQHLHFSCSTQIYSMLNLHDALTES